MQVHIQGNHLITHFTSIWFTSCNNIELIALQVLRSTIGTALTLKTSGSAPLLGIPRQGFLLCFIMHWRPADNTETECTISIYSSNIFYPSSIVFHNLCDYCPTRQFLVFITNKIELCRFTGLTSNIRVLQDITPCWMVTVHKLTQHKVQSDMVIHHSCQNFNILQE